jgi:hypothetical protein
MARPCLDRNPKFKLLIRNLGLPKPYVRGLLETLWDAANESGDPVIGSAREVEAAAEWPGSAGELFTALCEGRWLDPVGGDRWSVHDYFDHAPSYVRKRAAREAARQLEGKTISDLRREAARARWSSRTADGMQTDAHEKQVNANGATPAPKYNYKKRPSEAPASDVVSELNLIPQEETRPAGSEGRLGKRHRGQPSPNPGVKRLLDAAVAACNEFRGFKPLIRGAPEAQAMVVLLKGRTFAEAESLVREFYRDPPDWNLDQGCLGLEHIPAAATKILARGSTTPGTGARHEDELAAERRRKIMQTEKREYSSDPLWPGYEAAVAASAAPVGFITYAEAYQERQ